MTIPTSDALRRLGLRRPPVAVGFFTTPPEGLPRVERAAAAGCGYWKHASDGRAFYTTAEDHFGCPVGAFTHGAPLPPANAQELEGLVGTMIQLQYLRSAEVPGIPHRTQTLEIAAYAPLPDAPFPADVVIFRGDAKQIMLLSEAARAAGAFEQGTVMGRPACAMIPHSLKAGASVASVGCIGNRVYTGLGDDELYLAVPGPSVGPTLEQLEVIVKANLRLEEFHRARAAAAGA